MKKEQQRIDEFKRQMAEERQIEEFKRLQETAGLKKRTDRLEWMYQAPVADQSAQQASAEDILTGRQQSREDETNIKLVRAACASRAVDPCGFRAGSMCRVTVVGPFRSRRRWTKASSLVPAS